MIRSRAVQTARAKQTEGLDTMTPLLLLLVGLALILTGLYMEERKRERADRRRTKRKPDTDRRNNSPR